MPTPRKPKPVEGAADYSMWDVAQLLDLSRSSLYRMKDAGRLKVFQDPAGEMRVTSEEFRRLKAEHEAWYSAWRTPPKTRKRSKPSP